MAAGQLAASDIIDFESQQGFTGLRVYDCWEQSPFRTGLLTGNVALSPNIDTAENEVLATAPNPSATVAGGQRSRFGSNTFGLRVDLAETFELTPQVKYVHVMIHKPVEGRVMLVGLGSRVDVEGQDPYVEQFWETSINTVEPGQWTDAVFAIKGAGGINVRSLVVVPHCESPHNLTEDFLFYIDNIEINDDPQTHTVYEYYAISGNKNSAALTRSDRYSTAISISGGADGSQTMKVNQQSDKKLYQDLTRSGVFNVKPGESITPAITFNGTWMHAYCYVDYNGDGRFDYTDGSNEVVSYTYFDGKDSTGKTLTNQNPGMKMPAFTIPANLPEGLYRMRLKVDWDNIDPAGAPGDADTENSILKNGGVIVDAILNVHGETATVNDYQLNGEVLAADGSKLNNYETAALQPFTIRMSPENGFVNNGFTLKYGYKTNEADQFNKIGNPNWLEHKVPVSEFKADSDEYTIPAKYVWGNMLINGNMAEVGSSTEDHYPVNFDKSQKIERGQYGNDRHLDAVTFSPADGKVQSISLADNTELYVYVEKLSPAIEVNAGKIVATNVGYTGNAMHAYLYVDYDNNGFFSFDLNDNGTPADGSELVSFTCYEGKNSTGASVTPGGAFKAEMPVFAIPEDLAEGDYRARLKIDWNNVNPAGRDLSVNSDNKIWENGGAVLDFTFHVKDPESGIESITIGQTTSDDRIYDLQGRRVVNPGRGIYAVGSKVELLR